jgi:hypothetical protein
MPAVNNTAAHYFPQFTAAALTVDGSGNTVTNVAPLPCTIVKVFPGGSRVSVAVENPAQIKQTPSSAYAVNHVPYVAAGEAPPAEGPFVAPVGYTVPVDGTTHLPNGTPSSEGGESQAGA